MCGIIVQFTLVDGPRGFPLQGRESITNDNTNPNKSPATAYKRDCRASLVDPLVSLMRAETVRNLRLPVKYLALFPKKGGRGGGRRGLTLRY